MGRFDIKNSTGSMITKTLMGNKAAIILLLLSVTMALISPVFLTSNNVMNVIRQVAYSAILATGYTLVLSAGQFDLSIGTMVGLVGVVIGKLLVNNVPVPLAIAGGIVAGMAFSALNAFIITAFNLPAFIVTLATMSVYKGGTYIVTKMVPISNLPSQFVSIGQGYVGFIPVPILIMAFMVSVMFIILTRTAFGRHALAMGGNSEAARVSGINISLVRLGVYMTMGVYVAVASTVLTARSASSQISAGLNTELDAIAAVVIGGTPLSGGHANVFGSLFGCLIVGVVNNGLNLLGVDSNFQIIAKGLLILFAIVLDTATSRVFSKMSMKKAA